MESIDYAKLISLTKDCAAVNGVEAGACACHTSSIPAFARKGVVGREFAYEAISWLYNNYLEFAVNEFDGIGYVTLR